MKKVLLLLLLSLAIIQSLSAQEESGVQSWSDITLTYLITEKWTTGGDAGLRAVLSDPNWSQFYIRPNIRYRFTPWFNIDVGFGSFNAIERNATNVYEFRLFQDANFRWPDFGPVEMFHRIRFEERWFFYSDDRIENDFSARGRYLLGLETIDFRLFSNRAQFYFMLMQEIFLDLGEGAVERYVNQNRTHIGFGHRLNRKWRYELQYFWQRSRFATDEGFKTSENVLRLRVFHSFNIIDPTPNVVPTDQSGGFY